MLRSLLRLESSRQPAKSLRQALPMGDSWFTLDQALNARSHGLTGLSLSGSGLCVVAASAEYILVNLRVRPVQRRRKRNRIAFVSSGGNNNLYRVWTIQE